MPEIDPKSFGAFEKRTPENHLVRYLFGSEHSQKFRPCHTNPDGVENAFFPPDWPFVRTKMAFSATKNAPF